MYPYLNNPFNQKRTLIPVKPTNYHPPNQVVLFRKLLLLFRTVGLPIEKRSRTSFSAKLLAFLFHCMWALGTASTTCCLLKIPSSFYVFSIIIKLISLTQWWILYLSRHKIARLLRATCKLRSRIAPDAAPSEAFINLFVAAFVVFALIPGLNLEYQTITKDTMQPTCFHMYVPLPGRPLRSFAYFTIQTTHQLVNWTLSYIASLLIVFSCVELARLSRCLSKKTEFFRNQVEGLYEAMQGLEQALSLVCFFVQIRLFMEFFRVFSLLFNFVKGKPQSVSVINAWSYGTVTSVLFVALVFSADRMKGSFKALLKKMKRRSEVRHFSLEDVTLTGWGIFEINKKLLLSTVASLITYGVMLQQLQQ